MPTTNCPTCGHPIDDAQARTCPNCGATLPAPATSEPLPGGGGSSVPFEDTTRPFFERLIETVKLALASPGALFSNLPAGDIGPPVVYGVVIGTISMALGILWQMLFGGLFTLFDGGAEEFALSTGLLLVFLFFSPVLVVASLFISAGIYHLMLLLLGDASRGFPVTLRAVCYGNTPNLLAVVPFCGGLVGGIWAVVLIILGAYHGHRTDAWRAIVAYFLPVIACCCLAIVLAMAFGVIGGLASR